MLKRHLAGFVLGVAVTLLLVAVANVAMAPGKGPTVLPRKTTPAAGALSSSPGHRDVYFPRTETLAPRAIRFRTSGG